MNEVERLLQAAWEAARVPESGSVEPGQRYMARSRGGNFYTSTAVTRLAAQALAEERRTI